MADSPLPPVPPALTPVRNSPRRLATARTIIALILREMSTRYGRTPGGYLWTVLEPLAAILFLSIGFSLMVRGPSLGNSFILFYATGYMPFEIYMSLSRTCRQAISFSRPLLRYPAVTWVDAMLARLFLNGLTGVFNTFLLLGGILIIVETQTILDPVPIFFALSLAILLGLGVGSVNAVLTAFFPIWGIVWNVVNRPLFIASGIFYLYDEMPRFAQDILWYNPLIHIVGLMRKGFYASYAAPYVSEIYVLSIGLGLTAFGFLLLARFNREILNR
ncbi:ABC transporter permease [Tritonibacter scottomollicae]|uniref:Transport permease protein n=1 Tax=Tritonibacter scottomollicae TaxID=483013 RepID=A0A2T1A7W5_TRISK|nr:ABC transporter permease [Tritonibacter scottomollicae]PRZ44693.1 capsular polysaccharide transport system permease protein [Tritonibacter scottomollicae]